MHSVDEEPSVAKTMVEQMGQLGNSHVGSCLCCIALAQHEILYKLNTIAHLGRDKQFECLGSLITSNRAYMP